MPATPVLIIDDELSILEGLTEFLEDEGYEVHQCLGGKDGIERFRSVRPDVVMTDLKMPGVPGLEVVGEIRKIDRSTPIIVMTGYGSLKSAIDAIRMDVFDFITKPIDLDYLKNTLDRACSARETTQSIQKEMTSLREQVAFFQAQWQEQLAKFAEVEPLIHTGRLLAGIIHNLNNPLTYIMGKAELLQMLHPELDNIRTIQEQALRMKRIMSTILRRVKESQNREVEWLQLNEVLGEEVLFLESHPYFSKEIEKEWELDPDLPRIRGVAADFSQIFGNILRNAAEAVKGQAVRKFFLKSWSDSSNVYISIQDNGPGIPAHIGERVFQPFFSTKTSEMGISGSTGMGIGLYHSRELIRHYGGEIEVESRLNEGATFVVRVPHC